MLGGRLTWLHIHVPSKLHLVSLFKKTLFDLVPDFH